MVGAPEGAPVRTFDGSRVGPGLGDCIGAIEGALVTHVNCCPTFGNWLGLPRRPATHSKSSQAQPEPIRRTEEAPLGFDIDQSNNCRRESIAMATSCNGARVCAERNKLHDAIHTGIQTHHDTVVESIKVPCSSIGRHANRSRRTGHILFGPQFSPGFDPTLYTECCQWYQGKYPTCTRILHFARRSCSNLLCSAVK